MTDIICPHPCAKKKGGEMLAVNQYLSDLDLSFF